MAFQQQYIVIQRFSVSPYRDLTGFDNQTGDFYIIFIRIFSTFRSAWNHVKIEVVKKPRDHLMSAVLSYVFLWCITDGSGFSCTNNLLE